MKPVASALLENLLVRYPALEPCREAVFAAGEALIACYRAGGKLLICGNGGSCADGQHIVGELMKEYGSFMADRLQGALPAISLGSETALMTAYINDVNADMVFAQQVWGYGRKGDVLLALSTSGRSKNVVLACTAAKARGMQVIGMTGAEGRDVGQRSDVLIAVPAREAYLVQELHLPIWHALCLMLEQEFFGE